jgi:hypothetical protein
MPPTATNIAAWISIYAAAMQINLTMQPCADVQQICNTNA